MPLNKVASLLLTIFIALTPLQHSSATTQNVTKKLYGVKGATLKPTKVSEKKYSYTIKGKTHSTISKEASREYSQTGTASYYGGKFHGRKTASGEIYDQEGFTAAHKSLALGSYALVTNLKNNRKVIVRINDRGPFSKARIIDLSKGAAREIGMLNAGISKVRVEALHVDSQGYITGKGAERLMQLAKKEGLPLKIKENGDDLAIKATGSASSSSEKSTDKTSRYLLKVIADNEREANKVTQKLKQKTRVEARNQRYEIIVNVADQAESLRVKRELSKLGQFQVFSYSEK
ncbi:septal ring lytic transglycosylase RlpA family protein [Glaesserella sp.]|uniref:septal ring lytic transglycosylase RlpA family protein n=1 Tax=Glaesserella sp. TaxID=2094731 RepID=UPI00359F4046